MLSGLARSQVRSLASETAKQHRNRATPHGRVLDWYALDFHEELSAFEGLRRVCCLSYKYSALMRRA